MKSKLSFVLTLALLVVFCAPGMKGEVNPYYKPQLTLPSLSTPQAPVVYAGGVGYSSFGIKLFGGVSIGNLRFSNTANTEEINQYKNSLMGLAGGIGFETGGQVGFEVDVMYVQKGLKLKGNDLDFGVFEVSLVLDQISIPVLLRFKFMAGSSPYILLGGSVSYIVSGTAEYSFNDGVNSETGSQDLFKADDGTDLEAFNRLDYSVIGGGGFELAMGTMRIYFEGRYVLGMANIAHDTQIDAGDWMKLSTILFMGGIGF